MSRVNKIRAKVSTIFQVVALALILQGVALTTPAVQRSMVTTVTDIEDAARGDLDYHAFPAAPV